MKSSTLSKRVLQKRKYKKIVLLITDLIMITLAFILAYTFRYYTSQVEFSSILNLMRDASIPIILNISIFILFQYLGKQYQSIWVVAGIEEFIYGVSALTFATLVNLIVSLLLPNGVNILVVILTGVFSVMLCNGVRIGWRLIRRFSIRYSVLKEGESSRVLIVGAGSGGAIVLQEYKNNPQFRKKVIAFVDDDKEKLGSRIGNIQVEGTRKDIPRLIRKYEIDEVIIAIASLSDTDLSSILKELKTNKVKVNIMPGLNEMIDGKINLNMIREVAVEDLLARAPIKLDHKGISEYLENRVVMVTGGGGSIGSELCRQITKFKPKQLIIVDIYENNAYDLQNELLNEYPSLNLKTLIASVRDNKRMEEIFNNYNPEIVFHAAAHKHVPLMEESPSEAIKNNVGGTLICSELANKYNVKRFVLISTDKAVNPTNVMGATKRLCEMIIQSINAVSSTEFVAVRFGNVLGSNGSVVPLFKKQIAKGGPVTLTHKDITRYFMTIPEAAQLVLQAGGYANGGEIFVLDMGEPVRIYDLARNLITLSGYEPDVDIKINITGLRPGEKLYEELLMEEEGLKETTHKKIFIGQPGNFNLGNIKNQIDDLIKIANNGDGEKLKEKLKEVVPTYQEPNYERKS